MKYVIKWVGTSEYIEVGLEGYFSTNDLNYATRFDSIANAITAIERRIDATRSSWRNPMQLTIVGVKEIIVTPRYEEVLL